MPKKKQKESPAKQSERFQKEAQRLIDAGELSPIEGEKGLEKILRHSSPSSS